MFDAYVVRDSGGLVGSRGTNVILGAKEENTMLHKSAGASNLGIALLTAQVLSLSF